MQAGDVVKGGRQDRTLTVSLVLPPKSGRIPIASFCVEHGRWSARNAEDRDEVFGLAGGGALARDEARDAGADAGEPPAMAAPTPARASKRSGTACKLAQERLAAATGADVRSPQSASSLQLALENEKLAARARPMWPRSRRPATRTTTSSAMCSPSTASSTARRFMNRTGCSARCGRSCLDASAIEAISHRNDAKARQPGAADPRR